MKFMWCGCLHASVPINSNYRRLQALICMFSPNMQTEPWQEAHGDFYSRWWWAGLRCNTAAASLDHSSAMWIWPERSLGPSDRAASFTAASCAGVALIDGLCFSPLTCSSAGFSKTPDPDIQMCVLEYDRHSQSKKQYTQPLSIEIKMSFWKMKCDLSSDCAGHLIKHGNVTGEDEWQTWQGADRHI